MKFSSVYLNFNGNAEEAFHHYESVFGTRISYLMKFSDSPAGSNLPENEKNMAMHVDLPLPGGFTLMGSDSPPSSGQPIAFGNHSYIYLETNSKEEADGYFAGLAEGGVAEMTMQDTFWGAYFGSLKDRFGIQWMVSYTKESVAPAP